MKSAHPQLKKIKIEDLTIGMFIVNLGRSWLSHPFLRNQLTITSEKQIRKMRKYGIQEVYIDPQRGLDVPPSILELTDVVPSEVTPGGDEPGVLSSNEALPGEDDFASPPVSESLRAEEIPAPPPLQDPAPAEKLKISLFAGSSPEPQEELRTSAGDSRQVLEISEIPSLENAGQRESTRFWEQNIGKLEGNLLSLNQTAGRPAPDRIPFAQETKSARVVQEEAQALVRHVMHDIRMGRSIESERIQRAVNGMVESILRNRDALLSLTRIKKYDEYTFVHSLDVCILCLAMGRHLSLSREEMMEIGIGALLHDLGKMKISPHILKKPDRLNADEWVEVRKHPVYSLEIMEESKDMPPSSKKMALQHHERYDGSGYPFGLKGEDIELFAQVAGIADFYDAITSDRPYQKAIQPHEGIRQIYDRAEGEFNHLLVERFIQCIGIYPFGTLVLLDTEEMGIVCGVNPETLLRPKVLVIRQNSKKPYPKPFLADLSEKSQAQWYKRSVVMPLDAEKWGIRLESYLEEIRKNLNGDQPS